MLYLLKKLQPKQGFFSLGKMFSAQRSFLLIICFSFLSWLLSSSSLFLLLSPDSSTPPLDPLQFGKSDSSSCDPCYGMSCRTWFPLWTSCPAANVSVLHHLTWWTYLQFTAYSTLDFYVLYFYVKLLFRILFLRLRSHLDQDSPEEETLYLTGTFINKGSIEKYNFMHEVKQSWI